MTLRPPYTPITEEIYRQLPEGPPYYELIEGNLVTSPSPNRYHQKILLRLGAAIEIYLEKHPIGEINIAPSDVFFDKKNILQPDLYFVRSENRRLLVKEGAKGAPDLVVEVLSKATTSRDRKGKRQVYAKAGVGEMWIVIPASRQIEIHRLGEGLDARPVTIREPEKFSPAVFPGLRIDTVKLFKPPL
jgi:Uma2 family endonuclease